MICDHMNICMLMFVVAGHDLSWYYPSSLFGNLSDNAAIIISIEWINSEVGSASL